MSILRNPTRSRYTVIDSAALEDESISFESKGVLAYLLSKPDGWEIHPEHLSRIGGIGRHKMLKIFSELKKAGYIAYKKPRDESGRVVGTEIILCETPHRSGQEADCRNNRESENPTVGKSDPLVKNDLLVNLEEEIKPNTDLKEYTPPSAARHSKKIALDYRSWPEMPSDQVMTDWLQSRKTKRVPISQTVINSFGKALSRAAAAGHSVDECLTECITRGWTGFRLSWYENAIREKGNTHDQQNDRPRPGSFDDIISRIGQRENIQNCGRVFDHDGIIVEEDGSTIRQELF